MLCDAANLKRSHRTLEITGRTNVAAAWSNHDILSNIVYKERQKPSSERPVGHLSKSELQAEIGCGAYAVALLLLITPLLFGQVAFGFYSTLLWQDVGQEPTSSHQGRLV